MRKHHPILVLILLWICIGILLLLVNGFIFHVIDKQPNLPYTSLLASYTIQEGTPADVALFLLGGQGEAESYNRDCNYYYSTFGGGKIKLNTINNRVSYITRSDTYGAWLFYGFMLSTAIAEVMVYFHLRKEGYLQQHRCPKPLPFCRFILLWLCSLILLLICYSAIYHFPKEYEYNSRYPYTGAFSAMFVHEGMDANTAKILLGATGKVHNNSSWVFSTIGGGLVKVSLAASDGSDKIVVDSIARYGQIGAYTFWALVAVVTSTEFIIYHIIRKKWRHLNVATQNPQLQKG